MNKFFEVVATVRFHKDVIELKSFGNDIREAIIKAACNDIEVYRHARSLVPWLYGEVDRFEKKYNDAMYRFRRAGHRRRNHHSRVGSRWMDRLHPLRDLLWQLEQHIATNNLHKKGDK